MSEQDPLSTYTLWARQASILEEKEPSDYNIKSNSNGVNGAANQKENLKEAEERRRQYGSRGRGDSGYGGPAGKVVPKQGMTRRRLVPSSSEKDVIMYADEATQTTLGPTPPTSGKDNEYASTTRNLARIGLETEQPQESAIKAAKSKRNAQPPPALKPEVQAAQEANSKKSWSKRALARTKDILSITAKEPSQLAFEEFRNREFKKAGVKEGDNAAAKLHVSSQKLPPEAPKVQSKEPPPTSRNATDANTNANKSLGRFHSSGSRMTAGNFGGRGKDSSHSLASNGSRGSSVKSGSGRVSFTSSAGGSGSAGSSEMGQGQSTGQLPMPRLMHSQTDGAARVGTATSAGRDQAPPTKVLTSKQKSAAIDDRW